MTSPGRRVFRLRGRRHIEQVGRARRSTSGPIWVRFAPADADESGPPQVGYAVGRGAGAAVVRNRLRRRLRAVIGELSPRMAPGAYMVGAASGDAATLRFPELASAVRTALEAAGALLPEDTK